MKNETSEVSGVVGLIFQTEQSITTNQTYEHPPIISEALPSTINKFKDYSYNIAGLKYDTTYSHTYVQNCWVLDPIVPTYYAFSIYWAAVSVVWIIALRCVPERERFSLQKNLTMIPLFSAAETAL